MCGVFLCFVLFCFFCCSGWLFASKSCTHLSSALGCLCSATGKQSKSCRNIPKNIKRDSKHITSAAVYACSNICTRCVESYNVGEQGKKRSMKPTSSSKTLQPIKLPDVYITSKPCLLTTRPISVRRPLPFSS